MRGRGRGGGGGGGRVGGGPGAAHKWARARPLLRRRARVKALGGGRHRHGIRGGGGLAQRLKSISVPFFDGFLEDCRKELDAPFALAAAEEWGGDGGKQSAKKRRRLDRQLAAVGSGGREFGDAERGERFLDGLGPRLRPLQVGGTADLPPPLPRRRALCSAPRPRALARPGLRRPPTPPSPPPAPTPARSPARAGGGPVVRVPGPRAVLRARRRLPPLCHAGARRGGGTGPRAAAQPRGPRPGPSTARRGARRGHALPRRWG